MSETTATVREAAERITRSAVHVRIDDARLSALARALVSAPVPGWNAEAHFFDGAERSVMYLLVLDAMNFCFWPSMFTVDFRGRTWGGDDGYHALAAALTRAFEDGIPLWDPKSLANLEEATLRRVFRGNGEVPLFDARLKNARDIGETLVRAHRGDVRFLLDRAKGSAPALVARIAGDFAAYADIRFYRGMRVPVWKRAQLVVSDIIGAFGGKGYGGLSGAGDLTCFADYKLPQLFHNDGAFAYAPSLDVAVRSGALIREGSEEEIEIRAATIHAVEELKWALAALGRSVTSRELDWLLWEESIKPGRLAVPHHRTLTTSY